MTGLSFPSELSSLPVASLYEAAGGKGALPAAIKPIGPAHKLAGPALPLRCIGGSNLPIHRAVYAARPGDILVIAHGPKPERALLGEMLVLAAKLRQLGGIVVDGYVRDIEELQKTDFPVFSRGVAVKGPGKKDHPGVGIKSSLRVGNALVRQGDFVRGDADGVVMLPREALPDIVKKALARLEKEGKMRETMARSGARLGDLLGLRM